MDAMDLEYSTLENKMNAWDIVDKTKDMKVLGSICAFRCKLFPDSMGRILKARLCVRGYQQVEGIVFFETLSVYFLFFLFIFTSLVCKLITRLLSCMSLLMIQCSLTCQEASTTWKSSQTKNISLWLEIKP